ncbi:40S ribosomal protein S23, putative [Leishmania tarentolae]|uniref:40S ribosomal protein S23, putative n=1 Tax=Leishmania tarentolae TaxID=5689 RepID=A0A640KFX6_LEITA|nr:40S ribosomal protein S23, putative [Leishmania tarentolae]GET88365.1 40S ribosomal protein S23, putative [Leishmania tarentolae]
MTKTNGQNAARKLVRLRRRNRWADKGWKRAHTFSAKKANPFGGSRTPRVLCWRRSVSVPSSLTPPFVSVCVCS